MENIISAKDLIPLHYIQNKDEEDEEDIVDDLTYDLYNLIACDYHTIQLDNNISKENKENEIKLKGTRATQLLINKYKYILFLSLTSFFLTLFLSFLLTLFLIDYFNYHFNLLMLDQLLFYQKKNLNFQEKNHVLNQKVKQIGKNLQKQKELKKQKKKEWFMMKLKTNLFHDLVIKVLIVVLKIMQLLKLNLVKIQMLIHGLLHVKKKKKELIKMNKEDLEILKDMKLEKEEEKRKEKLIHMVIIK